MYLFSNIIGKPSQKFGLPFAVLLRSSLGFNGAKFFGLIRSLVGIFLFGIQTYFLSKIFVYLIRILLFTVDESILYQNIFIFYYFGLNIIDWSAIFIAIIFQTLLFSIGIQYNKKLINVSAITVYVGMILFFLIVFLNDVKLTAQAFSLCSNKINFKKCKLYNFFFWSANKYILANNFKSNWDFVFYRYFCSFFWSFIWINCSWLLFNSTGKFK